MFGRTFLVLLAFLSFSQGVPHQLLGFEWLKRTLDTSHNSNPYIVGGEVVIGREFPAQVSIRVGGRHFCGGSILNEEWIVTAAHCAMNPPRQYQVVAGSNKLNEGGTTYNVTYVNYNENYGTTPSKSYDIAVMKVSPKIEMGNGVGVVKLPGKGQPPPPEGTMATVVGWGDTSQNGQLSNDLLKLDEPVANHQTCSNLYDLTTGRPVDDNQICAGGVGGKDSCNGDSGGPLFVDNEMIGLVSWGLPCAHKMYPTVYTLVSDFIDWINANTKV